ncbi:MAG: NADH-quinone oxidoreductase subunit A [Firmicutes bacterium]|nr:NADH-quinone oxidoreductase subunit A [Bacillota bacterium]
MGAAWLLRPKPRQTALKRSTYESGIPTTGETWVRFRMSYYLYALVFVVFDVEAAFLYPWAVALHQLGTFAFVEAILFILILLVGWGYAWKEGALEWK